MFNSPAFIQNYFFEVFVIKHNLFGNISLGYFSAFKEIDLLNDFQRSQVLGLLKSLFQSSLIIGGDINSTPGKITGILERIGLSARISDIPSYMFYKEDVLVKVTLPSFDNFLVFDSQVENFEVSSLIKLPKEVSKNPRDFMRDINSPSDHVPVIGTFVKNGHSVKIGIYNVSDPMFWGAYYESTAKGFDISAVGEKERLRRLSEVLEQMVKECDLVVLMEVPSSFETELRKLANKFSKEVVVKNMSFTEFDNEGNKKIKAEYPADISKIVLLNPT